MATYLRPATASSPREVEKRDPGEKAPGSFLLDNGIAEWCATHLLARYEPQRHRALRLLPRHTLAGIVEALPWVATDDAVAITQAPTGVAGTAQATVTDVDDGRIASADFGADGLEVSLAEAAAAASTGKGSTRTQASPTGTRAIGPASSAVGRRRVRLPVNARLTGRPLGCNESLKPGELLCYLDGQHVGIFEGHNTMINALNESEGVFWTVQSVRMSVPPL